MPHSDTTNTASVTLPEPRVLPVRVEEKLIVSSDVLIMQLKLPSEEKLVFRAGQYIEFLLKDGQRRAYSIANAPHEDQTLELHLKNIPNGEFTSYVFDEMPEKTIMQIEGALGDFCLKEESKKPILMLATSTGFAPIKGIVEYMISCEITREVHVYWGGEQLSDLYQYELASRWADENSHIRFIPVLSQPDAEDEWQGFTGNVQDAVLTDFSEGVLSGHTLSQYEIYCSGVPEMAKTSQNKLFEKGADSNAFYLFDFTKPADI